MAEDIKTTLQFQADISDFKSATQEATRAIKLANSEFAAASSGMDDWATSTDGLSAKLRQLNTVHQAEQRKLEVLKTAYADVCREQGENSAAAQDLATKINNQQAKVNKAEREVSTYETKLQELEGTASSAAGDIKKAGDAAKDAGDAAKDSGEGWTIAKDVIADFISNIVQNAVDTLLSAAEATREYRREMARLAQNAADSGQDLGDMKETLAGVASVTGDADGAMEGLNMLMATGMKTDNLTYAAEALTGAATKFAGLSFESMSEGLQESLAVGAAVGPFAELIERTGGDLDAFNKGMEGCSTAAERQQYVMQWLTDSGLKGVHDSYVQNNADLVEAEKAQLRHNDAMASIGAAVEPISTVLTNLGATLLETIAPIVTKIVQFVLDNLPVIGPIITGIAAALGVLAAALAIQGIISGVSKAFAFLNSTMLANPIVLIVAAIAGLVAAFIGLWNNCEGFRNFWIKLWDGIKQTFARVVEWLKNAAASIGKFFTNAWQGIKNVWSAAGGFFSGVWSGIKNAFANVKNWFAEKFTAAKNAAQNAWASAKKHFTNVKNGITNAFSNVDSFMSSKFGGAWSTVKNIFSPFVGFFKQRWESVKGIFSAVKNVLSGNFSAAWANIKGIFAGWGNFFGGLFDKMKNAFANVGEIGRNIVSGLWNGLTGSVNWLKEKITGWVGDVFGFIKGLFGIHSPSTLMRDEVGKMLGLGMAEGILDSQKAVTGAMRDLGGSVWDGLDHNGRPKGGPAAAGGAGSVGGKTIVFNQTINSPKSVSRREIYRRTNNALSIAGGA